MNSIQNIQSYLQLALLSDGRDVAQFGLKMVLSCALESFSFLSTWLLHWLNHAGALADGETV